MGSERHLTLSEIQSLKLSKVIGIIFLFFTILAYSKISGIISFNIFKITQDVIDITSNKNNYFICETINYNTYWCVCICVPRWHLHFCFMMWISYNAQMVPWPQVSYSGYYIYISCVILYYNCVLKPKCCNCYCFWCDAYLCTYDVAFIMSRILENLLLTWKFY